MNIALLQVALSLAEITQLSREFPKLLFLSFPGRAFEPLHKEHWQRVEVLFGERLTSEDFSEASQLRWVHTPTNTINRLCIKEVQQRGNVLVSNTREENAFQIGEYVISVVLAFTKNLFEWKEADKSPKIVWDCKWRNRMETLKDKIFLQIGMGKIGEEIARRAKGAGMRVWGMDETRSFFPHCSKHFDFKALHSILPAVDVVSMALPREHTFPVKMGRDEIALLKNGSILTLLGSEQQVDQEALEIASVSGKLRGVLLDANFQTSIPTHSPLWSIPNLLLTPEVAPRPKKPTREAFRIFRFNLRQYLLGNFSDMKNLIDPSIPLILDEEWT